MKVLGVVPARSGSKGIPDKNIQLLKSVPLLAYSVFCGLSAKAEGILDELVVSTDSDEYLQKIAPLGYHTDYRRPRNLGKDDSPTIDVVLDVLNWCRFNGIMFDVVVILQPTSPFRRSDHLQKSISLLKKNPTASCVVGITSLKDKHPRRMKLLDDQHRLVDICDHFKEPEPSRRQDLLPKIFFRNGAVYTSRVSDLINTRRVRGDEPLGMEMDEMFSVNIDTPIDLLLAQACLEYAGYSGDLSFFDPLFELYQNPS